MPADDLDPLIRAAMGAIGEGVVITTADLNPPGPTILYVNPAFTRLTGYTPAEVLGQTPRILQGPGTDRAVLDRLKSDLLTSGRFKGEAVNYRKDGTPYHLAWTITAVRDSNGQPSHWIAVQRDISERKRSEEHQRVLLAELQHRVRNILAVVRSIARRSAATSRTTEAYLRHFDGRLTAISRAQALVTRDPNRGVDLGMLVSEELLAYRAQEGRQVEITGPRITLQPRAAESLGLALHELATNAVKFGALSRADGRIAISWQVVPDGAGHLLRLDWQEANGPPVSQVPRRGFGTELLEKVLAYELGARTQLSFAGGQARCRLEIPLTAFTAILEPDLAPLDESG